MIALSPTVLVETVDKVVVLVDLKYNRIIDPKKV